MLKELDGLKHARSSSITDTTAGSRHTPTMAQLSRTASTFVLDKLTHRPDLFRGQRPEEGGVQSVVPASAMVCFNKSQSSNPRRADLLNRNL